LGYHLNFNLKTKTGHLLIIPNLYSSQCTKELQHQIFNNKLSWYLLKDNLCFKEKILIHPYNYLNLLLLRIKNSPKLKIFLFRAITQIRKSKTIQITIHLAEKANLEEETFQM